MRVSGLYVNTVCLAIAVLAVGGQLIGMLRQGALSSSPEVFGAFFAAIFGVALWTLLLSYLYLYLWAGARATASALSAYS